MPAPISTKPASSRSTDEVWVASAVSAQPAAAARKPAASTGLRPNRSIVRPATPGRQPRRCQEDRGPEPEQALLARHQDERDRGDRGRELQHHRVDRGHRGEQERVSPDRAVELGHARSLADPAAAPMIAGDHHGLIPDPRARRRRPDGRGLESRQGVLRRARRDQARPDPLLPHRRGRGDARARRAARADGALPERRRRSVVLPEAGAGERPRLAADDDRADAERDALAGARGGRRRAPRLGRQPGLPRLPRVAVPRRRPRPRRRAAHRPRSFARGDVRDGARGRRRDAAAAGGARHDRRPEDDGPERHPRVRAARTSLRLVHGARGGGRARPGARAAPPRADHGRLVEGGAGHARVLRLQPERAPQDRDRRLGRAAAGRGAGVDAVSRGRSSRPSFPTSSRSPPSPAGWRRRAIRGRRWSDRRRRSSRCSSCTSATWPPGSWMRPWPPVYPKMPNEPDRVAPSRARKS